MTKLGKLMRRLPRERRFFLEACIWLGLVRLAILLLPFRRITPLLGRHMRESPHDDIADPMLLKTVSWAVQTAGNHLPWECKCLAQAMAAKAMLRCRGVASTLYLGVAKEEECRMQAHAWLRCGQMILTGHQGMDRFTVVAFFAETVC